jgi:hypothetical protein
MVRRSTERSRKRRIAQNRVLVRRPPALFCTEAQLGRLFHHDHVVRGALKRAALFGSVHVYLSDEGRKRARLTSLLAPTAAIVR